jgi:ABC-type cobalt transport system substrate-binding protein
MKNQNTEHRTQNTDKRQKIKEQKLTNKAFLVLNSLILVLFLFTCHLSLVTDVSAAEWGGVDESVVEKYAEEHGRAAREPFINTDQGDLLLFVFLLAGAVGGFAAGYYWRMLIEPKNNQTDRMTTAQHSST